MMLFTFSGNGTDEKVRKWLTNNRGHPCHGSTLNKLITAYQQENITFNELMEEIQCATGRTFNQEETGVLKQILLRELMTA